MSKIYPEYIGVCVTLGNAMSNSDRELSRTSQTCRQIILISVLFLLFLFHQYPYKPLSRLAQAYVIYISITLRLDTQYWSKQWPLWNPLSKGWFILSILIDGYQGLLPRYFCGLNAHKWVWACVDWLFTNLHEISVILDNFCNIIDCMVLTSLLAY